MNYKVKNEIINDKSLMIPSSFPGFYNHATYETTDKKGRHMYVFKGTYKIREQGLYLSILWRCNGNQWFV